MERTPVEPSMTIGIDPGIGGAIAVYDSTGYRAEDMPVMAKGTGKKRQINPLGVMELLKYMGNQTVYMELVNAMPKQGVSSVFSLGDSFGVLRATVLVMGYPLVLITPQTWKKYYKLTSDKERCRARAIELFPKESFNLKKDVDRAEAMLIAYYGANQK